MDRIIYDITQDRQGFLWMGTPKGLMRYDGYETILFRQDPDDRPYLKANRVNQVMEGRSGKVWYLIGNDYNSWLRIFDPVTEEHHTVSELGKKGFISYSMHYTNDIMLEDSMGGIWLRSNTGLYRVVETGKKDRFQIQSFRHESGQKNCLANDNVLVFRFDSRHRLWIGTADGLVRYDPAKQEFFHWLQTKGVRITSLWETTTGVFLAGTAGNGLFIVQPESGNLQHLQPAQASELLISKIAEDQNGGLWAMLNDVAQGKMLLKYLKPGEGLENLFCPPWTTVLEQRGPKGRAVNFFIGHHGFTYFFTGYELQAYHSTQDSFRPLRSRPDTAAQLLSLISFYEDRAGVDWFGGENGLFKHVPNRQKFTILNYSKGEPLTFFEDVTRFVMEAPDGQIWEGTRNGVFRMELNETFKLRPHEQFPYTSYALLNDRQGYTWFGTGAGLIRKDPISRQIKIFRPDPASTASLSHSFISALLETNDGRIWIGTYGGGLNVYDPASGNFKSFQPQPDDPRSFPSSFVYALYETRDGTLWIGTMEDIVRHDPGQKGFTSLGANTWVLHFLEDQAGRLWATSPEFGLHHIDKDKNSLQTYSTQSGFPTNECYGLLEDNRNGLWIATDLGLVHFQPQNSEVQVYNEADGIPAGGFSMWRPGRRRNGEMMFPLNAERGFLYFHPDSLRRDNFPPPVVITSFLLFNRLVKPGETGSPIQKAISTTDYIKLKHDQNTFSLEFSALYYASPEENQYAYRMEGIREEWIDLGTYRRVDFSGLPPGRYRFQVRAANHDGVWNEQPATLDIRILPPWWRSGLAYLSYSLLLFAIISGIYRFQLKRRLAKAQVERLRQLDEAKTNLYTNITHEFRTPLTIILGLADQISQGMEQRFREELSIIQRNGRALLQLVNQMLSLARVESGSLPVNIVQADIILFLRYQLESFHSMAENNGIELRFFAERENFMMDYDPEKVQEIISNLLSNAVKYTPEGGQVSLSARIQKVESTNFLELQVRDTGPGIPAGELPLIFDRFFRGGETEATGRPGAGIGLALTKELVKLLGGDISATSEYGHCTTFTVRLPVTNLAPMDRALDGKNTHVKDLAEAEALDEEYPFRTLENKPLLLIVEDNTDLIRYLRSLLQADYTIIVAENGQAGCEKALQQIPDIVLSDVMMPEMDGFALLSRLKEDFRTSHIPIVLLTAKADVDSRLEGLTRGADAYVTKPFHKEELLITLRKLIELRKKLQKRYRSLMPVPPSTDLSIQVEDAFMQQLNIILEENLSDENFCVSQLCRELGMSRSQLYRKVDALADIPVNKYIQLFRLHRARELLATTAMNITEVSLEVGFKTLSHFSTAFRQEFGVAPKEMR